MSITNHRHENNQYMSRKQTLKKRLDDMVKESQSLLSVAHSDVAAFRHSLAWLTLYISLIESVEKFVEFLVMEAGDLDDDDKSMMEQLERILGVLK
jgi:hypothetical protein